MSNKELYQAIIDYNEYNRKAYNIDKNKSWLKTEESVDLRNKAYKALDKIIIIRVIKNDSGYYGKTAQDKARNYALKYYEKSLELLNKIKEEK